MKRDIDPANSGPMFSEAKDAALLRGALQILLESSSRDPKKLKQFEKALQKPERLFESAGKALALHSQKDAPRIYRSLKRDGPKMLRSRRAMFAAFEHYIEKAWKRPLDLLEMLIVVCTESTEGLNDAWPWNKSKDKDLVFDVVRRLQARAGQVASEILVLLRSGYAPAAHARWRSLHETAVTASFIVQHGKAAAQLYLDHEHIEARKAAKQYQSCCRRLGTPRYSRNEMAGFRRRYDTRKRKYGTTFVKNEYGWAAIVLGKKRVTFKDIEEHVKLDHLRPYYKMASYPVHATVKSIRFSLALDEDTDVLLMGPSSRGLTTPGHSTAISLTQTTTTMFSLYPSSDSIAVGHVLQLFTREIGDEFLKAHHRLTSKTPKPRKK